MKRNLWFLVMVIVLFGVFGISSKAIVSAESESMYESTCEYTEVEQSFLKQNKTIHVFYDDTWYPYIKYDVGKKAESGIAAEVLKHISEQSGLSFEYVYQPIDGNQQTVERKGIIACMIYDLSSEDNGLKQSKPYYSLHLVMVHNMKYDSIERIGTLKRLFYINSDSLSDKELVLFDTADDCVAALSEGTVDAVVLNSQLANHYVERNLFSDYCVTALSDITENVCFAVSGMEEETDILLSILNKTAANIYDCEMHAIAVGVTMEEDKMDSIIGKLPKMTLVHACIIMFFFLTLLITFIIAYIRISIRVRHTQDEVFKKLVRDPLTGLLNENGLEMTCPQVLKENPDRKWFLIDFDINCFEHYNTLYGFKAGDELLKRIAMKCHEIRKDKNEVCARIHADHFVGFVSRDSIEQLIEDIAKADSSFRFSEESSSVYISYGVYEIRDRTLPISAMRDKALAAKRMVKGNYEQGIFVYSEQLHHKMVEDLEITLHIDEAFRNKEFVAYYQPKYDIETERIIGAEALVRWKRSDGSMLMPDRFITLFEKNGIIRKLDMYMLETVCAELQKQIKEGQQPVPISVNFSRNHIYDEEFVQKIDSIIAQYQIPHELIEVELTETVFSENLDKLYHVIQEIHNLGIRISIDDFGSGFSSLNMLKDMYFDVIKLDRGFLNATEEQRGKAIVMSVLSLAQELHFITVAEGVETEEQLEFLREYGCDIAQGYYFSKPIPVHEYEKLIQNGKE